LDFLLRRTRAAAAIVPFGWYANAAKSSLTSLRRKRYPIPFADRMNILEDFASGDVYPEMTFGGRTDEQYRKEADAAYERYQQARAVILTKGQSNG
jgi:hypothetical protein